MRIGRRVLLAALAAVAAAWPFRQGAPDAVEDVHVARRGPRCCRDPCHRSRGSTGAIQTYVRRPPRAAGSQYEDRIPPAPASGNNKDAGSPLSPAVLATISGTTSANQRL